MVQRVKIFLKRQDSLERRMFWSFLVVVTGAAAFSAAFTVFEGLSIAASLCSIGTAVICIIIAFVAVKTSLYNQCYLIMCCTLSCFLLPVLFLFCGGITSGMPLYCTASIILISFASRGKPKIAAFIVSICIQIAVIVASWIYPELVVVQLDRTTSYIDIMSSYVLISAALFSIGSLALWSYSIEREKNATLITKLDYLSTRDSLTGLYNRRYTLSYLENAVWHHRSHYFVAMLDLDDFKKLNRDYGHEFGDEIINTVGSLLQRSEEELTGECVARYGFEKFLYIINAASEVEAYAKVELIRKTVRKLKFPQYPQLALSISGGIVPCDSRAIANVKQLLAKVDELVDLAKEQGKDQIRSLAEG